MSVRVAMAVWLWVSCLAPGAIRADDAMNPMSSDTNTTNDSGSSSLATTPAPPPGPPVTPITFGDGTTGYIISADYAAQHKMEFLHDLSEFHRDLDFWTPTSDQVLIAERVFRQWIQDGSHDPSAVYPDMARYPQNYPPGEPEFERAEMEQIDLNYSHYARQYVGLIIHGHRVVFCNYFAGLEADPVNGYVFKNKVFAEKMDIHFVQCWFDPDARTCSNLVMVGLWQKEEPKF